VRAAPQDEAPRRFLRRGPASKSSWGQSDVGRPLYDRATPRVDPITAWRGCVSGSWAALRQIRPPLRPGGVSPGREALEVTGRRLGRAVDSIAACASLPRRRRVCFAPRTGVGRPRCMRTTAGLLRGGSGDCVVPHPHPPWRPLRESILCGRARAGPSICESQGAPIHAPEPPAALPIALLSRSKAASRFVSDCEDCGGRPILNCPINTEDSASLLPLGDLSGRAPRSVVDGRAAWGGLGGRRAAEPAPRAAAARVFAAMNAGA
jgi:hypothetical protein